MSIYTNASEPSEIVHFIYQTSSPSGKFYRGRHSTTNIDDGYLGSGNWIKSIKNKSKLHREILEFARSFEELLVLEEKYIAEVINMPNNMNFNDKPTGWGTGDLNPARTPKERARRSKAKLGISNVAQYGEEKAIDISSKIRRSRIGKSNGPTWNAGLTKETSIIIDAYSAKISKSITTLVNNMSPEERKEKYGNCGANNGFFNKRHSDITISALKEKQQANRINNRVTCEYCGKNLDKANYCRYHGSRCKLKAKA